MPEWSRLLTLSEAKDWKIAMAYRLADHARIVTLKESALLNHASVKAQLDLSGFERIHTLTLDCHNDVGCSNSSGHKGQWSYKRIMPCLPKRLKSLIILNAHGPDLQVIQRAIQQCGDLESLSLGRCTKFNRPNGCDFWKQFPNDHDSYFSGKGIEGYAKALGSELRGLAKLKYIFVNVYLTDTRYLNEPGDPSTVSPTTPSPTTNNGSDEAHSEAPSCPEAEQSQPISAEMQDKKDTKEAENTAANLLFECHASLKAVGFISFWSPDHLGWSVQPRTDKDQARISSHRAPDPGGEPQGSSSGVERTQG